MKKYLALLLILILSIGCSSSSDDDNESSGTAEVGQLSGNCSLRITNGAQCGSAGGPIALVIITNSAGDPIEVCTGAVLTPNRILSAAHCFDDSRTGVVRVGDEVIAISQVRIPTSYNKNLQISAYDLSVLELTTPLQNSAMLPILVSESVDAGDTVNIAGYGINENGESVADGLPFEQGLKKGEMRVSLVTPAEGVFYAEFDSTKESVCSGDSGGPVIRLNKDGVPGIVGVNQAVSDPAHPGEPRCLEDSIAVFTDTQFGPVLNYILQFAPDVGSI